MTKLKAATKPQQKGRRGSKKPKKPKGKQEKKNNASPFGVSSHYEPPEFVEPVEWANLLPEQRAFLRAIERRPRNWSYAARCALVARGTPYNWKQSCPEFAAALADLKESILDNARECAARGAASDPKIALEYLDRYEELEDSASEQEILLIEGDAPPARLSGG